MEEDRLTIHGYTCVQIVLHTTQADNYAAYKNYCFQDNSLNPKFHLDHCDYLDKNIIKVDFNCIELVIRTTVKNHLDTFCTINIIEPVFHNENLPLVYKELIVSHCNKHFSFLEKCNILIEKSDKLKLINDVFIAFEKEFNCS